MSAVRCIRDAGVAHIVLDRPAQLNAISPELLRDLDAACATIEADADVRAVALTGAGRAFCAGADLRVVEDVAADPDGWRAFMDLWHRVLIAVSTSMCGRVSRSRNARWRSTCARMTRLPACGPSARAAAARNHEVIETMPPRRPTA